MRQNRPHDCGRDQEPPKGELQPDAQGSALSCPPIAGVAFLNRKGI